MIIFNGRNFESIETLEEWLMSDLFSVWIKGDVFPIEIRIEAGEQGPVHGELKSREPWLITDEKISMPYWSITYTSPWTVDKDPTIGQEKALSALRVIAAQINAVINR